jgi:hypothetical protein
VPGAKAGVRFPRERVRALRVSSFRGAVMNFWSEEVVRTPLFTLIAMKW